jgi:hypothetical protein
MFGTARRNSFCVFAVNLPRNRVVNKKELPEDLVAAWTSVLLDVFEKQKPEATASGPPDKPAAIGGQAA